MVVGIGGFRDLGDPNDPRRTRGPVPQQANIAGLPPGDREIMRTEGDRMVYYSPEAGLSIEASRRARGRDPGKQRVRNALIAAELDNMAMADAVASSDPEIARRFFSDQLGQGELDVKLTSRAAELAAAMPEIGPFGALKIAAAEFQAGPTVTRRYPREVNRRISQEMVDKIGEMTEIRQELPLINRLEREAAAEASLMGKDAAGAMSDAEYQATLKALQRRDEAARRVDNRVGTVLSDTTAAENAAISQELGARGRLGQRNNPFAAQRKERPVTEGYTVPILVSELSGPKYKGEPASKKLFNREQRSKPFFDPRDVRVVNLDPQMVVPAAIVDDMGLTKMVTIGKTDAERDYAGVNIPSQERTYFAGANPGEQASYVPGFDDRRDLASNYVPADEITLAQAIQQLAYDESSPILTVRQDEIFTTDEGRPFIYTNDGVEDSSGYAPQKKLFITPMDKQPEGFADQGLLEVRVGSGTMLKDDALINIRKLLGRLPGMEGYEALMFNPLNDPTINQAQNRLLQMAIDEEVMAGARTSGDPTVNPTKKATHDVIKALTAAKGLNPTDMTLSEVEMLSPVLKDADNDYNIAIRDILRSSPGNPAVKELRSKYRQVGGPTKPLRDKFKSYEDGYQKYAMALGGQYAGDQRDPGIERIPTAREQAEMEAVRASYRDMPDEAFASQAALDQAAGRGTGSLRDKAVDFATGRQATIQAASNVPQAAVANAVDQSQLNAPASPQSQAGSMLEQTKQRVKNMFRGINR